MQEGEKKLKKNAHSTREGMQEGEKYVKRRLHVEDTRCGLEISFEQSVGAPRRGTARIHEPGVSLCLHDRHYLLLFLQIPKDIFLQLSFSC
jgi:hypothetical protein